MESFAFPSIDLSVKRRSSQGVKLSNSKIANYNNTRIMKHKSMKHKGQYSKKGKNKGHECPIWKI